MECDGARVLVLADDLLDAYVVAEDDDPVGPVAVVEPRQPLVA